MRYYEVESYTPYCGEYRFDYLAVPDDYDFHRVELWADAMCDENAEEWWDEDTAESYNHEYDDYRAECGWDLREISEEEYKREVDD